jgi:hypothetical protein
VQKMTTTFELNEREIFLIVEAMKGERRELISCGLLARVDEYDKLIKRFDK